MLVVLLDDTVDLVVLRQQQLLSHQSRLLFFQAVLLGVY